VDFRKACGRHANRNAASYKRRNKSKAFLLMSAIALEVAAILALAVVVAIIVEHG
jgi:hypothetical protein